MFIPLLISTALAVETKPETFTKPNYAKAFAHVSSTCDGFTVHVGNLSKDDDSEQAALGYPLAWLTLPKGKPVELFLAGEYNELLMNKSGDGGVCKGTRAFKLADGTVAISLTQSGRPFNDRMAIAFVDLAQRKVLAASRDIGASKEIEAVDSKVVVKIADSPSDASDFQVTVKGQKSIPHESEMEWWSTVSPQKGKLAIKVDPKITWERTYLRSYFKTQSDFEKAAKWNGTAYQTEWVYRVDTPDCVVLTKERAVASGDTWACAVAK